MHDKTARPTIRLLQEDLNDGWAKSYERRAASKGQWNDIHPFSAVEHPIVAKCADSLTDDPSSDGTMQLIVSSGSLRLLEVRMSQWRAGVWTDPGTGVRWIVAAGLAKGNHTDHDDFYERLKVRVDSGGGESLLPTFEDQELLRIETVARLLLAWELNLQYQVKQALLQVVQGDSYRFTIEHPVRKQAMGEVEFVHEVMEDCSELVVEFILSNAHQNSELGWMAITRILNASYPPMQGWDRTGTIFSVMGEAGFLVPQIAALEEAGDIQLLVEAEPGESSHYTHRRHLADRTIFGKSVRSLCGVYFVPMQDHERFPECPSCAEKMNYVDRLVPSLG